MNITQTDEYQALLRTVIEQRDEDAPRLIFADWLEENGESDRAEFIRIQCELAKISQWKPCWACHSPASDTGVMIHKHGCISKEVAMWRGSNPSKAEINERFRHLQRKEREVDKRYKWFQFELNHAWKEWDKSRSNQVFYTRGFISQISISWENWLENWQAIRQSTPLEQVSFTSYPLRVYGKLIGPITDGIRLDNWLK